MTVSTDQENRPLTVVAVSSLPCEVCVEVSLFAMMYADSCALYDEVFLTPNQNCVHKIVCQSIQLPQTAMIMILLL